MRTRKHLPSFVLILLMVFIMLISTLPAYAATVRTPTAAGTVTYGTGTILIDASNTKDGYIMVKYTGTAPRVKVRIKKTTDYTYDLNTTGNFDIHRR